ncbi:unnamed protein product [Phytophthora fragariaefolia]|uniref:Unnamed protein product n=1 Tax=Phytophthora fragariaefolia TaxID=1490495 RepID=A0A9W6Y2Y6_9STRA|nr:unnamed protein product [Phytophthora fragariaefolia]
MGQGIAKDHVSDEDYVDGDDAEEDDDDAEEDDDDAEEDDADDKNEAETSVVTDGKAGSEDDVNVIKRAWRQIAAWQPLVVPWIVQMTLIVPMQFVLTARNQAEVEASAKPRQAKRRGRPQTDNRILGDVSETGAAPLPKRARSTSTKLHTATESQKSLPNRHLARRRIKTWETRVKIVEAHDSIENKKPGIPCKTFSSWEDFHEALMRYEAQYMLLYRVRTSETRRKYNRLV